MSEKQEKIKVSFTEGYRGTYLNVLEPKAFARKGQVKGDPKYSGTFIVQPKYVEKDGKKVIDTTSDLGRLMVQVMDVLKANYPGKKLVIGRRMTQEELDAGAVEVNVPWQKGEKLIESQKKGAAEKGKAFDEEAAKKLYDGTICIKASSKYPVALDVIDNKTLISLSTPEAIKATGPKYFYSGAYFLPTFSLNFYKGDEKNNGGVSLYLDAVLFTKHGDRIGGRTHNAAEAYKGYLGKISQEDPTEGMPAENMDDEIPF